MHIDAYKNIQENLDKIPHLKLADMFLASCKACGVCCSSNIPITLSPHDLYRMARALSIDVSEVITRYCYAVSGQESYLPIVSIRHDMNGICPLLRNNRCSIQEHKPAVCRLYPLGRAYDPLEGGDIQYILPTAPCLDGPLRKYTVREWIGPVASRNSQRSFILWNELLLCLSMTLRANSSLVAQPGIWNALMDMIFLLMYSLYETEKPFEPQLEKNYGVIRQLMTDVFHIRMLTLDDIQNTAR